METQPVRLLSWENEVVEIEFDSAKSIKFRGITPNPGDEIQLMQMEIDYTTLTLIKDFLSFKDQFPIIKAPIPSVRVESIFPENSSYKNFFDNINNDQLLLLTLAAHNIQYEALESLCAAVIASKFANMDSDELVGDMTAEEMEIDEKEFYEWIGW